MKKFIRRGFGLLLAAVMLLSLLPTASAASSKLKPILTGYASVDYMGAEILKTLPLEGKSDKEKIRLVYDWIIKNNDRYEAGRPAHFSAEQIEANTERVYEENKAAIENGTALLRDPLYGIPASELDGEVDWSMGYDDSYYMAYRGAHLLQYAYGDCIDFAGAFAILTGLLGYECHLVSGVFINGDGSESVHTWNYILVNGEYYWCDIRIDHAEYVRRGRIGYYYFMEPSTQKWERQHGWDHGYSDLLHQYRYGQTQGLAATGNHFWDIGGHWAADSINKCYENQYFDGTGQGCFQPESVMTRAMLVTVLWRYAGAPEEGSNEFADVQDDAWYAKAVAWAAKNGVVTGVGNGRFDPEGKLTREQLATIFYRYAKSEGYNVEGSTSLDSFPDAGKVGAWAKEALSWAVAMKIVGGSMENGVTYLRPQGEATRAQVAAILVRFVENVAPPAPVEPEAPAEP